MMRKLVAVVLIMFVVAGCSGPADDAFGADLYSSSCAHCHGSDLAGGIGPPLGAGSNAATLTDQQIVDVIRIGPGAMTSFGNRFTEAQLDSLVDYLRTEQGS
jgi:mono/diheme cytochrome c family protein